LRLIGSESEPIQSGITGEIRLRRDAPKISKLLNKKKLKFKIFKKKSVQKNQSPVYGQNMKKFKYICLNFASAHEIQ
jgi:hypothetical protein